MIIYLTYMSDIVKNCHMTDNIIDPDEWIPSLPGDPDQQQGIIVGLVSEVGNNNLSDLLPYRP